MKKEYGMEVLQVEQGESLTVSIVEGYISWHTSTAVEKTCNNRLCR